MRFFPHDKRPVYVIIVGVFFICLWVLQDLTQPPQVGEILPEISEVIVPTPNLGSDPFFPIELSPTDVSIFVPTDQATKSGTRSIPLFSSQAAFGDEPKTNPILEKINVAGKEYPVWIIIPSINLSAPIVSATMRKVLMEERVVDMWFAPDSEAAGWHTTSAFPGETGNTVLSGHNNDFGHVFSRLIDLKQGDEIQIISQKRLLTYRVANIVLFQEVEVGLEQRMENARWISPSPDERLTLVTCWPYDSNTHRLVIVASPNR